MANHKHKALTKEELIDKYTQLSGCSKESVSKVRQWARNGIEVLHVDGVSYMFQYFYDDTKYNLVRSIW